VDLAFQQKSKMLGREISFWNNCVAYYWRESSSTPSAPNNSFLPSSLFLQPSYLHVQQCAWAETWLRMPAWAE